jgi:hypothetical protein
MTMTDSVQRKLEIGRVFKDTFAVIRRQAPLLLGITFAIYILPTTVSGLIRMSLMRATGASPKAPFAIFNSPAYWGLLLVGLLLGNFVLACQLEIAIADLEGRRPALVDVLKLALRKCLPLLAGTILLALGLWVGMLVLFVPGIILAVMWAVVLPAVVGETSNVFRAFGRSRALTRGNRWRIFGLVLLVLLLLLILDGVLIGASGGLRSMIANQGVSIVALVVSAALGFVFSVILSVGSAALYMQLREIKGVGGESVAKVFA